MIKKYIALLIIPHLITACATEQKYTYKLNQEIGKTYSELISDYGNPSIVKRKQNGDMIVSYVSVNTEVLPDPNFYFDNNFITEDEEFYDFTYGGNEIPVGNFMGETITNYCDTKFYLKNNIVTSWTFKGNSCVAM